jgi:hypothetical protein
MINALASIAVGLTVSLLATAASAQATLPSLPRHCMSDSSSGFYGFDAIGVPVQDRQIEAIAQKWVVLGRKVLLNRRQVSRERL